MQFHEFTPREQIFYLMRRYDIELAETFARRCPPLSDVIDVNTFFHQLLARYDHNTQELRGSLDDSLSMAEWLRRFEQQILPYLRQWRLPALTAKEVPAFYVEAPLSMA